MLSLHKYTTMNVPGFLGDHIKEQRHRMAKVNKIADDNERATAKEVLLEEIAEEDEAFKEGNLPKLLARRAESAKRKAAAREAASAKVEDVEPEVIIEESEKHKPSHQHDFAKKEPTRAEAVEDREMILKAKIANIEKQMAVALKAHEFDKFKELEAKVNALRDAEQEIKMESHRKRMAELDEEERLADEENAARAAAAKASAPTKVPIVKVPKARAPPRAKKVSPVVNIPKPTPNVSTPTPKVAPGRKAAPSSSVNPPPSESAPAPRRRGRLFNLATKQSTTRTSPATAESRPRSTGKYDRGAISRRAHVIKSSEKITWGSALKKAWAEARK